jgi:tetratricopeptide (TPR) repeat protein
LAAIGIAPGANAADTRSVSVLSRSLAIEESRSGASSPHLLPLLDRLAGAQFDDGALGEAAASRRRALKIALRTYGSDSTNAANAMVTLADVEILRHHYVAAESLLVTALPVLEARLGADNPALSAPLSALARVAVARGDLAAAEAWAGRANVIALRHPTAASSEPLRTLGAVYGEEERFDEGERVLRAALARDRQARGGANSLDSARSLAQLANLLLRAKRFNEALPLIEQAIAIDQERLGPTHPLIADDFADLGLIYAGLGRDDAAADALYFAIDLLDRGSAEETTRLAYAELEIAPILRRLGQTDDANDAFKDAKRILDSAANDERQRERQT